MRNWTITGFDDELDIGVVACPWGCIEWHGKQRQRGRRGAKHYVHSRVRFRQKMAIGKMMREGFPEENE
jgi:hypothetical protein